MKINGVEITAESFPVLALLSPLERITLDWHIDHIVATGTKDEAIVARFAASLMLAAVNFAGDRTTAAPALETTRKNAFRLMQFSAVAGFDRAVITLAEYYGLGLGTEQDPRRATGTLDVAKKICADGRYAQWIASVEDTLERAARFLETKTLQRPAIQ